MLALELAALAGLAFGSRRQPLPVAAALLATLAVTAPIAWLRPATPFYMTYALLPFVAGLGALGLYGLCAGLRAARFGAARSAGRLCSCCTAQRAGYCRDDRSGDVTLAAAPRLDVKQDDPTPALAEPWLPAYAVDASGKLLCRQHGPIVLHGAYAFLEHVYLGLDHRLRCGMLEVQLAGIEPAAAAHLVGPRPARMERAGLDAADFGLGGIGVAPVANALWPLRTACRCRLQLLPAAGDRGLTGAHRHGRRFDAPATKRWSSRCPMYPG